MTSVERPFADEGGPVDQSQPTRVAVIDRARTSREALCRALAADESLEVIDCGASAAPGLDRACGAFLFHVTSPVPELLDEVAAVVADEPEAVVIVVASYVDARVEAALRDIGATAVLDDEVGLDELLSALGSSWQPRRLSAVRTGSQQARRADALGITERELGVLQALSEGTSPQQIAHQAQISVSTVRDHLKHLRHKLDCASAVELVVTAHRLGLLPNLNRPLP